MTIYGIIVILWYSVMPYWWLLALLGVGLVASLLLGRHRQGRPAPALYGLSLAIGVLVALAAPYLTHSRLSYVATSMDYVTLAFVLVGAACYSALVLLPLFRPRCSRHRR